MVRPPRADIPPYSLAGKKVGPYIPTLTWILLRGSARAPVMPAAGGLLSGSILAYDLSPSSAAACQRRDRKVLRSAGMSLLAAPRGTSCSADAS